MYTIPRKEPWPPLADLASLREAIERIEACVSPVPSLSKVAVAMTFARDELDRLEREQPPSLTGTVRVSRRGRIRRPQ